MSTGGPDLFVICKNCGSEVSPYITECPYCGNRLRKRAPKLDRHGRISERIGKRSPAPSLSRLKRDEIPGIRHEQHPYATILLVTLGFAGAVIWKDSPAFDPLKLVVIGHLQDQWWRTFSAPFVYDNIGYAVTALTVTALYGALMERRHGPILVAALYLIGGVGGMAIAGKTSSLLIVGGNGVGLALLTAWAMPDLMRLLGKRDYEGDLTGTLVLGLVLLLMPLADHNASWVVAGVGVLGGGALGYLLGKIHPV